MTDGGAVDAPQVDSAPTCTVQEKLCDGACVAVSDPKYGCGATTCDASTCPNPGTGGTVVCQAAACVIGTCPANFKKCGNKCVSVTDPTYGCGAATCDATTCPAAGTGTLVCQAGACVVGTCGAGTKKCGDKCVTTDVNNGCADAAKCTACANTETCMGSPSVCACKAKTVTEACLNGQNCDTASDGCGGTVSCGTCSGSTPACVNKKCACKAKTVTEACLNGQNCGTAADGCGGTVSCGTCSGSTPACVNNKCACMPKTVAQACLNGQNCGTAADGCNGTVSCGTCSGGTPDCVSNKCACASPKMACSGACTNVSSDNAHCGNCTTACDTGNGQACTNGKCCTKQSARSLISAGGFDNSASLGNWGTASGGGGYMWTNSDDADGCSTSGSIKFTADAGGAITYCYSTGGSIEGNRYFLGMKAKGSIGCIGSFYDGSNCTGGGVGPDWFNLAPTSSTAWEDTGVQAATAGVGAKSIQFRCFEQGGGGSMDQVYLNVGSSTGFGAP